MPAIRTRTLEILVQRGQSYHHAVCPLIEFFCWNWYYIQFWVSNTQGYNFTLSQTPSRGLCPTWNCPPASGHAGLGGSQAVRCYCCIGKHSQSTAGSARVFFQRLLAPGPPGRGGPGRAVPGQSDLGWTFGVAWTRALRHAGSGCMLGQWISNPQSFKLSLRFKLPSESSEKATDPVRRAGPTRLFKINGFSMEFYRCFPLLWPLFRKNRSTYMLMVHDLFISVDNIFSACWFISMRSFSVTTRTLDNLDKDPPPPCVTEMACVACFWLNLRIILNTFWMIFDF